MLTSAFSCYLFYYPEFSRVRNDSIMFDEQILFDTTDYDNYYEVMKERGQLKPTKFWKKEEKPAKVHQVVAR